MFVVDMVGISLIEFYCLNLGFNCWVIDFNGLYFLLLLFDKVEGFFVKLVKIE